MKTDPFTPPSVGMTRSWYQLVVLAVMCVTGAAMLMYFLVPPLAQPKAAVQRTTCKNNLKQIAWAMHHYVGDYGGFPPAYTVDASGQRLHSWRTLILPYLEGGELYSDLDLAKPWNDTHNLEVFHEHGMPGCYRCPAAELQRNLTTYMAIVGPSSGLHPTESRRLAGFTDGSANSLLVVDVPAVNAIFWAQPDDAGRKLFLDFNSETSLSHREIMQVMCVDGSTTIVSADMPLEQREALLSIAGGEGSVHWGE